MSVFTKKDKATEEPFEALVDAVAKAKLFSIESDIGSVSLSSASSIDIQPSGTAFGLRLTKEQDAIIPMLLFDTKKLRSPSQCDGPQSAVDKALDNYKDNYETSS